MVSKKLSFAGRVIKEDGMFVVLIDGPNWTTHGPSFEEAVKDVPQMVLDYFDGYRAKGVLENYLHKLGLEGPIPDSLQIVISLEVRDVFTASDPMVQRVPVPIQPAAA